ncbi:MAG: cytochrome P450 [Acidimicrobiales bacterium]|nr:cytochrome P450 [Acidimicrobiales bacterium]
MRPPLAIADAAVWERGVPHELFTWLRHNEPVSWHEHPAGRRGFWCVSRWADVVGVSRDVEHFSSRWGVVNLDDLTDDQLDSRRTFLEEDPPRHTAVRALISSWFTPRSVRAYETVTMALASRVVSDAVGRRTFDAVSLMAEEVPIRVLARLLGVPDDRATDLVTWGNGLLAGEGEPDPTLPFGSRLSLDVYGLARSMAAERHAAASITDVTAALARGEVDGERLSDEEYCATWLMLVIAGNETTRHTISHGLLALAEHPGQLERWRDDPSLDAIATEEVIRWATPINWHRRQVVADTEIAGVTVQAGDKLILSFTSANRDEAVFADPFRFDVGRRPNDHVAFGRGGPHFCLGAHLARLEVRVLFRMLLEHVQHIELAGPPRRLRSDHLNGIVELPLTVS